MNRKRGMFETFERYRLALKLEEKKRQLYLLGTVIWNRGTYVKAVHGPIGIDAKKGKMK